MSAPEEERTLSSPLRDPDLDMAQRVRDLGRSIERAARDVSTGLDPEGVHSLRIALRTLDSVIPVLCRREGAEHLVALGSEVRALIKRTGPIRDAEVIWKLMFPGDGLEETGVPSSELVSPENRTASVVPPAMSTLMPQLAGEAEAARERVLESIRTGQFRRIAVLLRAATVMPWDNDSLRLDARRDAKESINEMRRCIRAFLKDPHDAKSLHHVRIRAKRIRYNVRFFRPLLGGRIRKAMAPARRIQDELGNIRDVAMTIERLAVGPDQVSDRVVIVRRLMEMRSTHALQLAAFLRAQLSELG